MTNAKAADWQSAATNDGAWQASIFNIDYSTVTDPRIGPYVLARLLSNLPVDEELYSAVPETLKDLAIKLSTVDAEHRLELFEAEIKQRADGDDLQMAVFVLDPCSPLPLRPPLIPEDDCLPLPKYALPPDGMDYQNVGRWLNHYMEYADQASPMSDPAFNLAIGLFVLSSSAARRVAIPFGSHYLFTNLYQLIVAKSTLFHKTSALRVSEAVMKSAGVDIMLLANRHTPESLTSELSISRPFTFDQWDDGEKERWAKERRFAGQRGWLLDEASHLFESFTKDYTSGLLPLVLELYDCKDRLLSQTVGRGRQVINDSYFSILGATTPSSIREFLKNDLHWKNGLWARFGVILPAFRFPEWRFMPERVAVPEQLVQDLHCFAFEALPLPDLTETEGKEEGASSKIRVEPAAPIEVRFADHVREAWEAYAKATSYDFMIGNNVEDRYHANYGRFHISAVKVAALLATADWGMGEKAIGQPCVTLAHWFRAQAIVETWRANIHHILQDAASEEQIRENRILRVLKNHMGTDMTVREIGQYAHLSRDEVERELWPLVDEGFVDRVSESGQRTPRYRLGAKV